MIKAEEPLRFLFFGDMMLDREIGLRIKQNGLAYFFEKIAATDLFQDKDIISCNLEGAVTNGGAHYAPDNVYDFAFSPEVIGQLRAYNFNFFNLANNHLADQGDRGLLETRTNLGGLGIGFSGCPDGQVADCSYEILEIKNKKIGLVGLSMVYGLLRDQDVRDLIAGIAADVDLVLVSIHWGAEYVHNFNSAQQTTARLFIDSGADLVVGHHPHVVQGIEIYNNRPIFYSLGNFIFDQYFSVDTQRGLAVEAVFGEDGEEFLLRPLKSTAGQISLMEGSGRDAFLRDLAGWSRVEDFYSDQIKAGRLIFDK
ncbi:MAG: CapA family protein [bacterium]